MSDLSLDPPHSVQYGRQSLQRGGCRVSIEGMSNLPEWATPRSLKLHRLWDVVIQFSKFLPSFDREA